MIRVNRNTRILLNYVHSSACASLMYFLYRVPHTSHFNTPCCLWALPLATCVICISWPPGKPGLAVHMFPMETVQQRLINAHTPAVSQCSNVSCTRGRGPLVCYINNNKLSFHGTSPVLSCHRDVRHLWMLSVVLPLCSRPYKSFTHHSPHYLEVDQEVMFKVGVSLLSSGFEKWCLYCRWSI